jgi:hypothetical protein
VTIKCFSSSLLFSISKYVVFPGNVGSSQALFEAAQKLCFPPSASTPPSPDSKTSLASCVTPTRPVFASSSRTLDLLEAARAKGEAVGAFNVYNLEGVRAVVRAAAATNSSAILQVHPSSLEFGGQPLLELCRAGRFFVEEMGTMRGSKEKDTIAVHLDHANEAAVIEQVLVSGHYMTHTNHAYKLTPTLLAMYPQESNQLP